MSSPARDAAPDSTQDPSNTLLQDQHPPAEQRRSSRASSAAASAALSSSFAASPPVASAPKSTPRRDARKPTGRAAAASTSRKGKQTVVGGTAEAPDVAATAVGDSTTNNYVPVASGSGSRKTGAAGGIDSAQNGFQTSAELPPVPEGEELDMLRQVAVAALAAQDQSDQDAGAGGAPRTEPARGAPPALSAKPRGKRKADEGGEAEAAPRKGKAPARRSRSVSVAGSTSVDGGEEAVKPKVRRDKKPLKKITKKSVRRPELPAIFKIDNPNQEVLEERKKELQRGMDP